MPSPPLDELPNTTINEPLDWDPFFNFRKTPTQTDASYEERFLKLKRVLNKSIHIYIRRILDS